MIFVKGITMTILTVKLPDELSQDLTLESQALHMTKGAVVRAALKSYIKTKKSTLIDQIKTITQSMLQNKRHQKKSINWQILSKKCQVNTGMTPEEEVQRSRSRGLLA